MDSRTKTTLEKHGMVGREEKCPDYDAKYVKQAKQRPRLERLAATLIAWEGNWTSPRCESERTMVKPSRNRCDNVESGPLSGAIFQLGCSAGAHAYHRRQEPARRFIRGTYRGGDRAGIRIA